MNGINQMIAQGIRMPQIESPLNQLAQVEQIRQAQQANMLRQQQMAEMQRQQEQTIGLNKLIQQAYDPATGRIDESKLVGGMARGGYGSNIMPYLKQSAESQEAAAKASEARTKAALERLKIKRIQLENITTPDGYVQWALSSFDDPALRDVLREMGSTPERVIAEINQAAQQPNGLQTLIERSRVGSVEFEKLLRQREEMGRVEFIDAGGVKIPVNRLTGQPLAGVPAVQQQPLPSAVELQKSRIAKSGAAQVNVSTEKAYGGQIAKLAAEQDIALADQAAAIPRNIAKVDEALDLLYNSDINTGLGAEVFNVMDKARAKFISDKEAGKRVESTEYLDALLGSDVFPQISALGIGARGLDTPAEREFLRNVITGTINLDKSTLIRMTEFRRRALEEAAKVYNSKVEGGELDKYFEFTGRPKNKVEVPERPSRSQGPRAIAAPPGAVNFLRQNDTPENRRFFDQKYGAGASRSVLGR